MVRWDDLLFLADNCCGACGAGSPQEVHYINFMDKWPALRSLPDHLGP